MQIQYGVEFYFPQFRTYTSEYLHFDSCRNAHSEESRLRYVAGPIFVIICIWFLNVSELSTVSVSTIVFLQDRIDNFFILPIIRDFRLGRP